jgi:hypothetical protein
MNSLSGELSFDMHVDGFISGDFMMVRRWGSWCRFSTMNPPHEMQFMATFNMMFRKV